MHGCIHNQRLRTFIKVTWIVKDVEDEKQELIPWFCKTLSVYSHKDGDSRLMIFQPQSVNKTCAGCKHMMHSIDAIMSRVLLMLFSWQILTNNFFSINPCQFPLAIGVRARTDCQLWSNFWWRVPLPNNQIAFIHSKLNFLNPPLLDEGNCNS